MMTNGTAQQQSNSKASTVEAAIEYIKNLQKEVKDCKDKIAEYEKGMEGRKQATQFDGVRGLSATKGTKAVAA